MEFDNLVLKLSSRLGLSSSRFGLDAREPDESSVTNDSYPRRLSAPWSEARTMDTASTVGKRTLILGNSHVYSNPVDLTIIRYWQRDAEYWVCTICKAALGKAETTISAPSIIQRETAHHVRLA